MSERVGQVWVVAGPETLSAAITAALTVVGWPVVRLFTEAQLADAARRPVRAERLVLVAGERGALTDPRPALAGRMRPLTVAVGGRPALPALAEAVGRHGAVAAIDADQPFTDLVLQLDAALLREESPPEPDRLVAALRTRDEEARRFGGLTSREQEVLGAMVHGRVAAEIAAAEHLSMATVRSHIRTLLAKLEVSSQLAAIALTHRSCREPRIVERMRQVHQF